MKNIAYIILLSILTFSCSLKNEENGLGGYIDDEEYQKKFIADETDIIQVEMEVDSMVNDTAFIDFANNVIAYLETDKLTQFATTFHPKKGCRFVPYTYMVEEDLVFNTVDFQKELPNSKKLHWGMYDGSGEPIDLTIRDYFKQFVYDVNYKDNATEIHINSDLMFSNALNNIGEFYPDAQFIEFYFEGTTEYEGMDWSSLIFYIEKLNDIYYLVAVVHNQWTI